MSSCLKRLCAHAAVSLGNAPGSPCGAISYSLSQLAACSPGAGLQSHRSTMTWADALTNAWWSDSLLCCCTGGQLLQHCYDSSLTGACAQQGNPEANAASVRSRVILASPDQAEIRWHPRLSHTCLSFRPGHAQCEDSAKAQSSGEQPQTSTVPGHRPWLHPCVAE